MRRLIFVSGALATLALAGGAGAQTRPSGFFSVSGQGASGWTIECTLEQPNGQTSTSRIRGIIRTRERYLVRERIASASCTFAGGSDGPFQLRVNTEDFACPFEGVDSVNCVRTIRAGETGEIKVSLRE